MALLAEEIVEEWLNRQGYFTIRGIKLGVDEIDILAIRPMANGALDRRHVEVQASMRPISYISRVPKEIQKASGRAANSVKRDIAELEQGVVEWIHNKFDKVKKIAVRNQLAVGEWTRELVIHRVKSDQEVRMIQEHGIVIHHLSEIVQSLTKPGNVIAAASGADLMDLVQMATGSADAATDMIAAAVYRATQEK